MTVLLSHLQGMIVLLCVRLSCYGITHIIFLYHVFTARFIYIITFPVITFRLRYKRDVVISFYAIRLISFSYCGRLV